MFTNIFFNHGWQTNTPQTSKDILNLLAWKFLFLSESKCMIWLEVFEILALMMHQKVEIELLSTDPHSV